MIVSPGGEVRVESMPRASHVILIAAVCPLASCATLRSAGRSSVAAVKNTTSSAVGKISSVSMPKFSMPKMPKIGMPDMPDMSLARLLPNRGPQVVEVREKDLKELPTGMELAKAHERERKRSFWFFGGPVDFKEPTLPEPGSELDGSLLPPRLP